MPVLNPLSRRHPRQVLAVALIYGALSILGLTMVAPFLITISGSLSNDYDYQRFGVVPRYFYSIEDRFVKGLAQYFNSFANWRGQLAAAYPGLSPAWNSWSTIGRDAAQIQSFAELHRKPGEAGWEFWENAAADYADFVQLEPLDDLLIPLNRNTVGQYLAEKYEALWRERNPQMARQASDAERRQGALDTLATLWGVRYRDFATITFDSELNAPLGHQSWFPPVNEKYLSYLDVKQKFRRHAYSPGVAAAWKVAATKGIAWDKFVKTQAPAIPAYPFALRVSWQEFLQSDQARTLLKLSPGSNFTIEDYNRLAGTNYSNLSATPFPLPADLHTTPLKPAWDAYRRQRWPLRLTTIKVTPALQLQFTNLLKQRFHSVATANEFLKTTAADWSDFTLTRNAPASNNPLQPVWQEFAKDITLDDKSYSSSEIRFQALMHERYNSLKELNQSWGSDYQHWEEVFPPFSQAYAIEFRNYEWPITLAPALLNYATVFTFLTQKGDAIRTTLLLILLSIFVSLTVNPLCAYALSRFNLPGQGKIILFLLASSAFPAMISAIPGFLLMRDLGMLNTFAALLLPAAANGMGIFMLKGFFDSLPPELYEAATIDGAPEWRIFLEISLPLIKPILAVNALGAFMGAYQGWEWALIICQDPKMWTVSVWMIQASTWWSSTPWLTSAGFIVVSIPILVMFIACQKVILRGIILPQMK